MSGTPAQRRFDAADLHAALSRVALLLMDVDGVLTDGRLYFGFAGEGKDQDVAGVAFKGFHVRDGLGIALLREAGIATGIVTGRHDPYVRARARELRMDEILLGVAEKGAAVAEILSRRGLEPAQVAYLGDDVNDLPAFARCGVPIAVGDAHPGVLPHVRHVTRAAGGFGAVREVADAILAARAAARAAP